MADKEDTDLDISAATNSPSFSGRLRLTEFMYKQPETASSAVRRSPRVNSLLPQTGSSPGSPSKSPGKAATRTPVRSSKRKHESPQEPAVPSTSPQTLTKSPTTTGNTTPSPKKRKRVPSSYAPPSTYAHLPQLEDVLALNLLILFVGLNPGLQTARSGHAYAHPSNLFWKLLFSSGITPVACRAEEDRTLPERFALGNTNIVARPSRNGAELSKAEMDEGVAVLEDKVRRWRPEVVCVVGKSIWESIWRVRKGRPIAKAQFRYGWQDEGENMGVGREGDESEQFKGARVFVATSTSGLAATLRPAEKEAIWKELGDWCKMRRKERDKEGAPSQHSAAA